MGNLPTWAWVVIIVVLAAIVVPIKLRVFKQMMTRRAETTHPDDE